VRQSPYRTEPVRHPFINIPFPLRSFDVFLHLRPPDRGSVTTFLVLGIWHTPKSNHRIHASDCVTYSPGKVSRGTIRLRH
jgi:hypothetical protein